MKISTLFYTLGQGIRSIFRNKWYSLASVATITACLFLFGLFYAIVMNFEHIVKSVEEDISVTVFFEEGTSDARVAEIGDLLKLRPEVADLKYVSSEEAWEEVKETILSGDAEGFTTNPVANSNHYVVYLSDVARNDALVTYIKSIPEVRKVNDSSVLAKTLSSVNLIIAYVSLAIIVLLLAVSVFLISNTVTIGISVRQEEIGIMKYIGATDFFVRAPFVIEGMLIGAIGAAIPLGIIYPMYNKVIGYAAAQFPSLSRILKFLTVDEIFSALIPISFIIGVGIGFLGSFSTVKKHLRV